MSVLIYILGCNKATNIFKTYGLPDINQEFSYIYFKTENVGYLFGTLTNYDDLNKYKLQDSVISPKYTDEATVYETKDGGKNWVKIDFINDYSFYNSAFLYGDKIFIKTIDSKENLKNYLVKFDINSHKTSHLNFNFERMGQIWSNETTVFINSKNNGVNSIYSISHDFKNIDSVDFDKVLKNNVLNFNNSFYVLTWYNEIYDLSKKETIKLPIMPNNIVKQNNDKILIAGNSQTSGNEVILVSYDVKTIQVEVLKKIKGYSIIENLQSNEKVICGFIGNIKGAFTEYDLLYSTDKGKTWSIQKLEEPNYVRPSCLVGNILYIYSGGRRMQKITFPSSL